MFQNSKDAKDIQWQPQPPVLFPRSNSCFQRLGQPSLGVRGCAVRVVAAFLLTHSVSHKASVYI